MNPNNLEQSQAQPAEQFSDSAANSLLPPPPPAKPEVHIIKNSGSGMSTTTKVLGLLGFLIIGAAIGIGLAYYNRPEAERDYREPEPGTLENFDEVVTEDQAGPSIIIITPQADDNEVGGDFEIRGMAQKDLGKITVLVTDNSSTQLFKTDITLDQGGEFITEWVALAELTGSPRSTSGKIVAYPTSEGASSQSKTELEVVFGAISD